MDQTKEIRALYLKGYMKGDTCNIMLLKSIGLRESNGEYKQLAAKGEIVKAVIIQDVDGIVKFQLTFPDQVVNILLFEGKVR